MEADDFLPNRLEAAKDTASLFVDLTSQGTKIAVLSFSGNSFIEQGLTDDKTLIKQGIRNIPISAVGGTDLSEAVITASNLLKGETAKTIILISDGNINVGTIESAIDYANEHDAIVHAIGIGTEAGGLTTFGSLSTIDEEALKSLAHNTRGQYFRAETVESMEESLKSVLGLELGKTRFDTSAYLVIISLAIFVIEYILINTRYKVLP